MTAGWLAERLDDPGIRIVDCRFSFERDCRLDYDEAHLPGAVYLDWSKDLTDLNHPVAGMIAPPEVVSATLERLGIGDDTRIVAYDQEGGHFASAATCGGRGGRMPPSRQTTRTAGRFPLAGKS